MLRALLKVRILRALLGLWAFRGVQHRCAVKDLNRGDLNLWDFDLWDFDLWN
jgi:hypothetical protein